MGHFVFALALLCGASPETPEGAKTEIGVIPLAGGNTDLGFGGGALASVARVGPGYRPYLWRAELGAVLLMKNEQDSLTVPYHDFFFQLTVPKIFDERLRLGARASFTRSKHRSYYGLGNASSDLADRPAEFHRYARVYPAFRADARWRLNDDLYLRVMPSYSHNEITIYEGSKLAQDVAAGRIHVAPVIGAPALHVGMIYDSRDDELITTRGMHHELSIRGTPFTFGDVSYAFGGVNLTTRFFFPIWDDTLVFAARLAGDMMFGEPPVYELGQIEEVSTIGGESGVRGVPGQRYAGQTKLYGNVELRTRLFSFAMFDQSFVVGTSTFLDAGRVFAGTAPDAELDGTAIALKWGAGGGLRLHWGETFVVRADFAYSPDADPISAYVNAGHAF